MKKIYNFILSKKYISFIAILYFIFFCTPILSPSFFGYTIYIHPFLCLLDFNFLKDSYNKLKTNFKDKTFILFTIILLVSLLLKKIGLMIELLIIIETIFYLLYCYNNRLLKYLLIGININIFICIIQFLSYYFIKPEASFFIGPNNIAKLVWGNHATDSFSNFTKEIGLVRFSGWSRESGFFSSLIMITLILYLYKKITSKISKFQIGLLILGIILSISKISFVVFLIFGVLYFKKYINKIPYYFGVLIVLIIGIIFSSILCNKGYFNLYNNGKYNRFFETFGHRFGGYVIITNYDFKTSINGVDRISDLPESIKNKYDFLEYQYKFKEFDGLPSTMISYGIIIFILLIFLFKFIGFNTSLFWVLILSTISVTITTSTSFVMLTYLFIYLMIMDEKNIKGIKEKKA